MYVMKVLSAVKEIILVSIVFKLILPIIQSIVRKYKNL